MSGSNGDARYGDRRFRPADESGRKWKSRYDLDTSELQNLNSQGLSPIYTEVLDLSVARPAQNPYKLGSGGVGVAQNAGMLVGRAISVRGVTTATVYNPNANTGIEAVVTTAIVMAWFGKPGTNSDFIVLKHGGGYRGDFGDVYLFWPAQSNNSMRVIIYRFDDDPWQPGDAAT